MGNYSTLNVSTRGENFYDITGAVKDELNNLINTAEKDSGILHLFVTHTSCALTISESYDPSAREDLVDFMKHLAPRNLPFIKHTCEGPDDSPSHMKSILLQQSLSLIIDKKALLLGQWQGIYLCEFRDSPKNRSLYLKFRPDFD